MTKHPERRVRKRDRRHTPLIDKLDRLTKAYLRFLVAIACTGILVILIIALHGETPKEILISLEQIIKLLSQLR